QIFEIFAKAEYHVGGVEGLTAFAIDQRFQVNIGRVGLVYGDARAQRAGSVEILWEAEMERPARCLARGPGDPIGEHRDAPDVILQLGRLQIDAALAENDRNLALVIEAVAALGINQLTLGPDNLARQFPEAPETGFADFLVGVALVGAAAHPD